MKLTRTLVPRAPYDFPAAARYVAASASHVLEQVDADLTYRRALVLGGRPVLVSVSSVGSVAHPQLKLSVSGDTVDTATMREARRFVTRVFTLDADSAPFVRLLDAQPQLRPLRATFGALRPVLLAGDYESLIWAILGQQVTTVFAAQLKRALIDRVGDALVLGGERHPLLPTPRAVATLTVEQLRELRFSRQKAGYVLGLSQAVTAGELDLFALGRLPAEAAIAALTAHRGVGRWTAECVLMRGLGRADVIPAADVGLRRWAGRALGLAGLASETQVRDLAARVPGYEAWLAFAAWDALQKERVPQNVAPY